MRYAQQKPATGERELETWQVARIYCTWLKNSKLDDEKDFYSPLLSMNVN